MTTPTEEQLTALEAEATRANNAPLAELARQARDGDESAIAEVSRVLSRLDLLTGKRDVQKTRKARKSADAA